VVAGYAMSTVVAIVVGRVKGIRVTKIEIGRTDGRKEGRKNKKGKC
jgi:hypothetical protein